MAKKKTVSLDCDIKKAYQSLYDVTESISTYGTADLNEVDKHDLKKLSTLVEEFAELYGSENSDDGDDDYESAFESDLRE